MADAWKVYGGMTEWERMMNTASFYADARQRVLKSRRLSKYMDIILSDGYATDDDHLRWVVRGRVGEIEAWAKQIQEDRNG
jgi:hypothetical protein